MTISKTLLRVCLFGMLVSTCRADLHLVTENMPPYNYVDPASRQVIGLSVDLLDAAVKLAHVKIAEIEQMPMVRAIELAHNQADTCVFPLIRTPDREARFRWIGPYAANHWVFYARDDFKPVIRSLDDARRFRIGSDIHGRKTAYLKSLGFTTMDLAPEDALNARMLSVGRFDLWLAGLYEGRAFADQAGVKNIHPVFEVARVDYYLACNPHIAAAVADALQSAVAEIIKTGEAARLEAPYRAASH